MQVKKILGQRLLELRKQKGLSQKAISDLLSVTRTQVSDIENGKSGTNLERFVQLCEFYRCLLYTSDAADDR